MRSDTKRRYAKLIFVLGVISFLPPAARDARGGGPDPSADVAELAALKKNFARPRAIPFPASNPYTSSKADLGRLLFFDPRLSGTGTMSCASCHNPALSWGDGLPTGRGAAANKLGRHSPSILNLAWADALMWDGRADTLEQQATGPIEADAEMNKPMPELLNTLAELPGYRVTFEAAFPGQGISKTTIAQAIATFERTIVSNKAPFDQWIDGDETAITDSAKRGFKAFNGAAHCSACHSGWRFTDDSFHDIGLPSSDIGRGKFAEGIEPLQYAFKTPGLRNIAERAPYMHDGSIRDLAGVIRHYDGKFVQRPSLSEEIFPLNLPQASTNDLVAFLKTLTSTDDATTIPTLPSEANQ